MTQNAGIDISPKNDGGVLKNILQEGVGTEIPTAGSKVQVHYVGKLTDGTVFDSSRDRGEPFEFNLGKGNVIKAWDIGVATMKKGELAILTCAPEYAYGANGSPPKIPPNATLQFEVEVLGWKGEDLSPNKDGGIERLQIVAGEGYAMPNDGALVDVHLLGTYEGHQFDERDIQFTLGEGSVENVIEGVEKALEKFKKNEQSRLIIKPKYAFGSLGKSEWQVPPNATVEYVVTLKSFEKAKECWSLDTEERIQQAMLFKEKGTGYYKASKFDLAVKLYKKVLSFIDFEKDLEGEIGAKKQELILSAHLNLSLCYLKLNEPLEARDACTAALKIQNDNEKALFRRGQAQLALAEPELALEDFNQVLKLEPNNKAAISQIAVCKSKLLEQRSKEKKIYANMFEKFARKDAEKEEEERRHQPDVMKTLGEWGEDEREREPTNFEKENPNILMLNNSGEFKNM